VDREPAELGGIRAKKKIRWGEWTHGRKAYNLPGTASPTWLVIFLQLGKAKELDNENFVYLTGSIKNVYTHHI
jgi:hypothetical protein